METPLHTLEACYFSMFGLAYGLFIILFCSTIFIFSRKVHTPFTVRALRMTLFIAFLYCGPLAINYLYPFHVLDEQGCGHQSPSWVPPGLLHQPSQTELDNMNYHRTVIRAWIRPPNQPTDPSLDCID